MTELVIGRSPSPAAVAGRKFKNIRHFSGAPFAVDGVTRVYVEPGVGNAGEGTAEVVEAYRAVGVDVHVGLPKKAAEAPAPETAPAPAAAASRRSQPTT